MAWWIVRSLIWFSETNKQTKQKQKHPNQTKTKENMTERGDRFCNWRKYAAAALPTALGLKQALHRVLKSASAWDAHTREQTP